MDMNEVIKRINELAAKAKTVGLTEEEIVERDKVRRIYIDSVKASLTGQLEHTTIVYPDGTKKKVERKQLYKRGISNEIPLFHLFTFQDLLVVALDIGNQIVDGVLAQLICPFGIELAELTLSGTVAVLRIILPEHAKVLRILCFV